MICNSLQVLFFSPLFVVATFTFVVILSGNRSNNNRNNLVLAFASNSMGRPTSSTKRRSAALQMSTSTTVPTWENLKGKVSETPVGKALDRDLELRSQGRGSPHVHSKLRLFDDGDENNNNNNNNNNGENEKPVYTLFRDHAGWCP